MYKTFKSAKSTLELGVVRANTDHVRVWIEEADKRTFGMIDLAPSDAPALALAILEAAGYSEEYEGGNCWAGPLGQAMHMLRLEAEARERITAEVRERAELEAEALELCNAYRKSFLHCAPEDGFDGFDDPDGIKAKWLAVARRAREMRAEK